MPISETPPKYKHTLSEQYVSPVLGERRSAVMKDLGDWVPEVPLGDFLQHLLPQSIIKVQQTLHAMEDKHIIGGRWTKFPQDPNISKEKEPECFGHLAEVINAVASCSVTHGGKARPFFQNPNRSARGEISNDTRPDGYFLLDPDDKLQQNRMPMWSDICILHEYKKDSNRSDVEDNARKVVWNMQHVLREDPCRRFTFGMTIENTQMRIWFCCRSAVLVSAAFNFITNHWTFIDIILRCLYSERWQLGWDPTMCRVENGNQCYNISVFHELPKGKVKQRNFQTTKILSDFSAAPIRGRATRVFEAYELDEKGEKTGGPVAIKDTWIDADRKLEGDILIAMKGDIERLAPNDDVENYFLSIQAHGVVRIQGRQDDTLNLIMRGYTIPDECEKFCWSGRQTATPSRNLSSRGTPPSLMLGDEHVDYRRYPPKVHYRCVYNEVGIPLRQVQTTRDIFLVLRDVVKGLQLMSQAGWVHRDISSGNMYLCQGQGKMGDFEFSKQYAVEGSHEFRTGTFDYMAVEVHSEDYLFIPDQKIKAHDPIPQRPFRYNPLHDIESTWWVAVRTLLGNRPKEDKSDSSQQKNAVKKLFPGSSSRAIMRLQVLRSSHTFLSYLKNIPPDFDPLWRLLEEQRFNLREAYEKAEQQYPLHSESFGIHDSIHPLFEKMSNGESYTLSPL